jgi:hypothetical protein
MYTTAGKKKDLKKHIHDTEVSHGTNTNIKILPIFYIHKYSWFQVPLPPYCTPLYATSETQISLSSYSDPLSVIGRLSALHKTYIKFKNYMHQELISS